MTQILIIEDDPAILKGLQVALKEEHYAVESESDGVFGYENARNHDFDLIIDGIFGFSLKGDPRPPADKIIEQINCSQIPVLSIDVPSGLDCETGQLMNPAVKATYTVTLGMPKIGLDRYKDNVGKLYLGDVGIPQKAYQKLDIYTPIFLGQTYISLN